MKVIGYLTSTRVPHRTGVVRRSNREKEKANRADLVVKVTE